MDKTTELGTEWSDDILAYRLLKNANLTEQNEQLAKATIEKLEYEKVKAKLKSIFGDSVDPPACSNTLTKAEEIDFAGSLDWQDGLNAQFNDSCNFSHENQSEDEQTFYFSSRNQPRPPYNQDYARNNNYSSPRPNYNGQFNNGQFNSSNRGQRFTFNRKQAPRFNNYPQRGNYNQRFQRGSHVSQKGSHPKFG